MHRNAQWYETMHDASRKGQDDMMRLVAEWRLTWLSASKSEN